MTKLENPDERRVGLDDNTVHYSMSHCDALRRLLVALKTAKEAWRVKHMRKPLVAGTLRNYASLWVSRSTRKCKPPTRGATNQSSSDEAAAEKLAQTFGLGSAASKKFIIAPQPDFSEPSGVFKAIHTQLSLTMKPSYARSLLTVITLSLESRPTVPCRNY